MIHNDLAYTAFTASQFSCLNHFLAGRSGRFPEPSCSMSSFKSFTPMTCAFSSCCWNRGPFNIGITRKQGGSKLIKEACSLDVIGYMCCFPYYLPKLSGRRLVKACDNRISVGLNTHVPAILMLTRVSKFLSVAMCL